MCETKPRCRQCDIEAGHKREIWGGGYETVTLIDFGDHTFLCHLCAMKELHDALDRMARRAPFEPARKETPMLRRAIWTNGQELEQDRVCLVKSNGWTVCGLDWSWAMQHGHLYEPPPGFGVRCPICAEREQWPNEEGELT